MSGEQGYTPEPGDQYTHYKGGLYEIVTMALDTETGQTMIVYRSLSDSATVWVRPWILFNQSATLAGVAVDRFTLHSRAAEQLTPE